MHWCALPFYNRTFYILWPAKANIKKDALLCLSNNWTGPEVLRVPICTTFSRCLFMSSLEVGFLWLANSSSEAWIWNTSINSMTLQAQHFVEGVTLCHMIFYSVRWLFDVTFSLFQKVTWPAYIRHQNSLFRIYCFIMSSIPYLTYFLL